MTDHADLETRVHQALRALPLPRAPQTLLPRVMAAVGRAAERPWYERAWLTWPIGWRAASGALLALVAVALIAWFPVAGEIAGREAARVGGTWLAQLSRTIAQIAATFGAAEVVWRTVLLPLLGGLVVVTALASLACAAAGAVLFHVSAERTS